MNRSIKAFITFSVLLNLLLVGLFIGHMGRPMIGLQDRYTVQEIAMALPEGKRQSFQSAMDKAEQDTGELRQQLIDARNRVASILRADPFDKAAYLQQMQLIHTLHGQVMEHMIEVVAQEAEQSTPQERAILADMLRHPPRSVKGE